MHKFGWIDVGYYVSQKHKSMYATNVEHGLEYRVYMLLLFEQRRVLKLTYAIICLSLQHKHCRHKSKSRDKRKSSSEESDNAEKSTASRAGLTVLELLELQARARAIRAQLQQEQIRGL